MNRHTMRLIGRAVAICVIGLGSAGLLTACSDDTGGSASRDSASPQREDQRNEADHGDTADATAAMKKIQAEGRNDLKPGDLASAERLRQFLPPSAAGMPRRTATASPYEPNSPIMSSSADATYLPDDVEMMTRKRLSIGIMDSGSMRGMTRMIQRDIDHRADGRHTKSIMLDGYRALQEVDTQGQSIEVQLLVPPRLLVTGTAQGLSAEAVKRAIASIDLDTLAEQASNGGLARPTAEDTATLPDADALVAALPKSLPNGYEHAGGSGYAMQNVAYPFAQAQANYRSSQKLLQVTVEAHKSARHAAERSPATAAHLIQSTLPGQAEPEQVMRETWAGQEVLVLNLERYRMAVARATIGAVIVQVRGQALDQLKPAFEALDFEKIQRAATAD